MIISTYSLHQANDVNYVLQHLKSFVSLFVTSGQPDLSSPKSLRQGENMDTFYNRILKLAHQCDFSDMNERLIDAIIFGTTCVKAQDKLLQMPNTLNLQQCLTVCRHYESLSLHIQQIRSGADKQVEFLHKCHPKSKKPGPNKPQQRGQNLQKFPQPPLPSQQKVTKSQKKMLWLWP